MAFKDIIGQDRAVNILLKTVRRGRIPSSYLFAGESGIGKKFAAINLAKVLNCLNPVVSNGAEVEYPIGGEARRGVIDACDECPSCMKIDAGVHPDFLLVSPESGQIRIEAIRTIDEVLSLKAFEGRYKVIIVDDAEGMNQYAANAFLKTLEEPPEDSLIILVSSNTDRLPDTIKSRCSRINFTPLSYEACGKVIKKVIDRGSGINAQKKRKVADAKKKKSAQASQTHEFPESVSVSLLVRLSMGRPGAAIAGNLFEDREWFIKLFNGMLGAEKDGWASKEEMEKWFDQLLIMLRDMAVLKATNDSSHLISVDIEEYIDRLSNSIDLKIIIENYMKLNALKGCFIFNLNKSLTWNYTGSVLRKMVGVPNA
jgi:DNA polymerase-3 subunit delta'